MKISMDPTSCTGHGRCDALAARFAAAGRAERAVRTG
jgi:ferredoxin